MALHYTQRPGPITSLSNSRQSIFRWRFFHGGRWRIFFLVLCLKSLLGREVTADSVHHKVFIAQDNNGISNHQSTKTSSVVFGHKGIIERILNRDDSVGYASVGVFVHAIDSPHTAQFSRYKDNVELHKGIKTQKENQNVVLVPCSTEFISKAKSRGRMDILEASNKE